MGRENYLTDVKSKDPPGFKSTDSKPINATKFRRFLTVTAIKLLRRWRPRLGVVLFLPRHLCVKYGDRVDLSEAAAMQFVRENTSLPVPKVHCAFTRGEKTYIVMDRVDGDMLVWGWRSRSEESKAKIHSQLKHFMNEMRQLPPAGPGISNVDGGSVLEPRIALPTWRFGPYSSVQAFHEFLHNGLRPDPRLPSEINDLIAQHDGPWPSPTFTHGDLSSLDILAKGDQITGIVDWEGAGWFPSYWEYTSARQVNIRNLWWIDEIDEFLDPFPTEQAMELVRQEHFW